MKLLNRFSHLFHQPNAFYIMLPFLLLGYFAPWFGNKIATVTGAFIGTAGLAALVVKDFYDVQRGDFLRQLYKATPNHRELLPYQQQRIQEDKKLQTVQKIVLAIVLIHLFAAFLGTVAGGIVGRVAAIAGLLLPLCAAGVYGLCGSYLTLTEAGCDFDKSGFGRIFGRNRVSLGLYFPFSVLYWFLLWAMGNGGSTLLQRGRYYLAVGLFSCLLVGWFFLRAAECRHSKPLAVTVAAISIFYSFLFVDAGNRLFESSPPEYDECQVIDVTEWDYRYDVSLHHDDYLTVETPDGQQLVLHMPYDSIGLGEINSVKVALHRGGLDIAWAEILVIEYS